MLVIIFAVFWKKGFSRTLLLTLRNIRLTGLHWSHVISLDIIFKHFDICTSWLQSLESLYRVKLTQRRPATFLLRSPLRLAISFFCVCVEEAFFNCIVVDFLPEPALPLSSGGATGFPFSRPLDKCNATSGSKIGIVVLLIVFNCWFTKVESIFLFSCRKPSFTPRPV